MFKIIPLNAENIFVELKLNSYEINCKLNYIPKATTISNAQILSK